jgi:hypothetical protein
MVRVHHVRLSSGWTPRRVGSPTSDHRSRSRACMAARELAWPRGITCSCHGRLHRVQHARLRARSERLRMREADVSWGRLKGPQQARCCPADPSSSAASDWVAKGLIPRPGRRSSLHSAPRVLYPRSPRCSKASPNEKASAVLARKSCRRCSVMRARNGVRGGYWEPPFGARLTGRICR